MVLVANSEFHNVTVMHLLSKAFLHYKAVLKSMGILCFVLL